MEWGKAVAKAKRQESDPVEALKLAKRIYGKARRAQARYWRPGSGGLW